MVFPQSSLPVPPILINPLAFGNMVHRNVWNHTAQVLREINRISNQIHDNLAPLATDCIVTGPNCASSASACAQSSASSQSVRSQPTVSSINGDTFEMSIRVDHFKPEEITVKLTDSNNLIVEGKHEERSDDRGFVSRSFSRRFLIPENYDTDKLESLLSLNGILTIKAPRKPIHGANGEKIIPITLTSTISSVDASKSTPETVPTTTSSTAKGGNNQTSTDEGSDEDKAEASTKND